MRKNYTLPYAISITILVLPIILIVEGIILIIESLKKGFTLDLLWIELIILGISLALVFLISLGLGYYVYKKSNYEIKEEDRTVSNGIVLARKKDIYKIKARRFIFVYSFDIYCKPWPLFSFISYYFYSKSELIEFINKNSFFKEYIRRKDIMKLGIKNL